jgi:methyl coenzyme M reductase gamma subunit
LKEHKLDVQDEGQMKDFLGVRIWHNKNGMIEMSQPHLIQQILQDLNMGPPIGATTKTSSKVYAKKSWHTCNKYCYPGMWSQWQTSQGIMALVLLHHW